MLAFKGAYQEDGKGRAKGQMLKGGSLQWTAVGSVQRVQGAYLGLVRLLGIFPRGRYRNPRREAIRVWLQKKTG